MGRGRQGARHRENHHWSTRPAADARLRADPDGLAALDPLLGREPPPITYLPHLVNCLTHGSRSEGTGRARRRYLHPRHRRHRGRVGARRGRTPPALGVAPSAQKGRGCRGNFARGPAGRVASSTLLPVAAASTRSGPGYLRVETGASGQPRSNSPSASRRSSRPLSCRRAGRSNPREPRPVAARGCDPRAARPVRRSTRCAVRGLSLSGGRHAPWPMCRRRVPRSGRPRG